MILTRGNFLENCLGHEVEKPLGIEAWVMNRYRILEKHEKVGFTPEFNPLKPSRLSSRFMNMNLVRYSDLAVNTDSVNFTKLLDRNFRLI